MKRSIFGVYQFDEVVGAVVLACVGVFVAVLINAGLLKDWFQPSFTLRILLPDEGVSGLAPGAEVQVLGTRAGEVRRIVIDPNQRMHAVARVEDQMRPFIRRDSVVSIRRQFGVAPRLAVVCRLNDCREEVGQRAQLPFGPTAWSVGHRIGRSKCG